MHRTLERMRSTELLSNTLILLVSNKGLREGKRPSHYPTKLVAEPKSLSPQALCTDSKLMLLSMPHHRNSLFALMPPRCVMKTNYSLAVGPWILWINAACQCTWWALVGTKAGKKRSPPWQKPWTEHSPQSPSSLDIQHVDDRELNLIYQLD